MTRGWILNEIVRRVDDRGRTIGEILQSDICEPLGGIDVFIGLTPAEMTRVAPVENATIGYLVKQSLVPKARGRKIDLNFFELVSLSFVVSAYDFSLPSVCGWLDRQDKLKIKGRTNR